MVVDLVALIDELVFLACIVLDPTIFVSGSVRDSKAVHLVVTLSLTCLNGYFAQGLDDVTGAIGCSSLGELACETLNDRVVRYVFRLKWL
jgi:hypothetical protein